MGLTVFLLSSCGDDEICAETIFYIGSDNEDLGDPDVSIDAYKVPTGHDSNSDELKVTDSTNAIVDVVDESLVQTNRSNLTITTKDCTLSDGTKTQYYQIVTNSTPDDHAMGLWCLLISTLNAKNEYTEELKVANNRFNLVTSMSEE